MSGTTDLAAAKVKVGKKRKSHGARRRVWQRRLMQLAGVLFFIAGAGLLSRGMQRLDWNDILQALHQYQWPTITTACGIALAGYAIASSFDLLCQHYERHRVSREKVLATGFVSLAFSMNLGALIGGWGMRYRLYSRFGLPIRQITRIICLAILTNWSGFVLLSGLIFTFNPPQLPVHWQLHGWALNGIGVLLLICTAGYLLMCAYGRGRSWRIRGVRLRRPSLRFAGLQLALSSASWMAMAAVLNYFLPPQISFINIMGVLFVSSIAGLIIRVPAGLGVLEVVFLTLLNGQATNSAIIAALLAFRAAYYLLPLSCALMIYGVLELQARQRGKPQVSNS